MLDVTRTVADQLRDAGFLAVLFPVLSVVGPLLLGWYGVRGVRTRSTLALYRLPSGSQRARQVTGVPAVALGVVYLLSAVVCAVVMLPVSASIVGLW